jgi:hypothetical protein
MQFLVRHARPLRTTRQDAHINSRQWRQPRDSRETHASRLAGNTIIRPSPACVLMFRVSPMIERPRPVVVRVRDVGTQYDASTHDANTCKGMS